MEDLQVWYCLIAEMQSFDNLQGRVEEIRRALNKNNAASGENNLKEAFALRYTENEIILPRTYERLPEEIFQDPQGDGSESELIFNPLENLILTLGKLNGREKKKRNLLVLLDADYELDQEQSYYYDYMMIVLDRLRALKNETGDRLQIACVAMKESNSSDICRELGDDVDYYNLEGINTSIF